MASASGRAPSARRGPARKTLPYVSSAAGHARTSMPDTSGASGPRTNTVPSTLPVGPEYGFRFIGLTTAATRSLGRPSAFGALAVGAAWPPSRSGALGAAPCSARQPMAHTHTATTAARSQPIGRTRSAGAEGRGADGDVEVATRRQAEDQHENRAHEERRGHVSRAHRNGYRGAGRGLAHVHVDEHAQVVIGGDHAVDQGDDREPVQSTVDRSLEDEPLAEEPGGRRYPCQRNQKERERERGGWMAFAETREIFVAHRLPSTASAQNERAKRSRSRNGVREQIVEKARARLRRVGRERCNGHEDQP